MKHRVSEVNLKDGIKGLFIDVPGATVMSFTFDVRAGEYLTDKPKWETAHLMEHVLLGANEKFPKARNFQAELEKNGAYSNASTGVYDIVYEAECADFEWQRVLELMLLAISRPLFLEEEFTAEVGNVREELESRSNNHFRHLNLALRQATGFLSLTDRERLDILDNVTLKDIAEHYKKTHTKANTRFIIAGDIKTNRAKIIETIEKNLRIPTGDSRIELPNEFPNALEKPLVIKNKTVPNLYFYIDTYIKPKLEQKERDALSVASTLLTDTLYSRILGTAREKGLVYGMGSGQMHHQLCSGWWLGAQVSVNNAPKLFKLIRKELKTVADGKLEIAEVEAARQYLLGRHQRSGQTVGGTAGGYTFSYYMEDKIDDYYAIPERLKKVQRRDVVAVINQLFEQNIWSLGLLGSVGEPLAKKLEAEIKSLWG